jgi:hypothetical protein
MITHETTEQLRARTELNHWISVFVGARGQERRAASKQIRTLANTFPWLGDSIPDDVWYAVYRVRAAGTVAPPNASTRP